MADSTRPIIVSATWGLPTTPIHTPNTASPTNPPTSLIVRAISSFPERECRRSTLSIKGLARFSTKKADMQMILRTGASEHAKVGSTRSRLQSDAGTTTFRKKGGRACRPGAGRSAGRPRDSRDRGGRRSPRADPAAPGASSEAARARADPAACGARNAGCC
jgi:hypothetical protein